METDLIDEHIKQVNKKVTPIALVCAALIAVVVTLFGPFSDKFSILFFTLVVSIIAFSILYQLLFYLFGKEVVNEAKKRKRYFYKILDFSDDEPFSFEDIERPKDDPNFHTDSRYSYLSYNIHNTHH